MMPTGDIGREMDGHAERAFLYRQKAEELRGMISDMKDQQTRETLESIARGYDQLANVQESLAKADKTIGKP